MKKILIFLLSLSLVLSMLTACTKDQPQQDQVTPETTEPEPTPDPTPDPVYNPETEPTPEPEDTNQDMVLGNEDIEEEEEPEETEPEEPNDGSGGRVSASQGTTGGTSQGSTGTTDGSQTTQPVEDNTEVVTQTEDDFKGFQEDAEKWGGNAVPDCGGGIQFDPEDLM